MCNQLVFMLSSAGSSLTRNWNIKVTQYECGHENMAPDGCTKYFFGANSGYVKTYNFDAGLHLADQHERMCIRRERNMCRICYSTEGLMDFDLTGSTAQSVMVGKSNKCCGYGTAGASKSYDCVIIPEASKVTAPSTLLTGNAFCGGGTMGGLATVTAAVPSTVCSKQIYAQ